MFVHGAWVTPACWDHFKSFYEAGGYTCLVPGWPYIDKPVAELKKAIDPRFADQTINMLVDHYTHELVALPEPPILIGHSFGGLIVQLLLDRGLGRLGVAIDAGPPRGVFPSLPAFKSALPVLLSWNGWNKLHTMSFADFCSTFANGVPASEQRVVYDAQIIQAPGRIYFQAAIGLGNAVNFANSKRAPLLLIAGEKDLTATPSMVRAMYKKHQKSPMPVDMIEFPGRSHYLIAEPGWQEVAGAILAWIEKPRA
ncbi:MAG: alpha/beta fold hydrolase [Bradyrhizobium sp.]